MSSRILLLLMLVGCEQQPPGCQSRVAELAGTYAIDNHPAAGETCNGVLPFINYISLYEDGIAQLDDSSGGSTLARWVPDGNGFSLSQVTVSGWSANLVFAPSEHFADQYEGPAEWWNPSTRGTCSEWWLYARRWSP